MKSYTMLNKIKEDRKSEGKRNKGQTQQMKTVTNVWAANPTIAIITLNVNGEKKKEKKCEWITYTN